ncbi:tRNA pseudouridine synthase-like 1 isoform X1 [Bufo gargarizans]|uniref:tRNA pseudouridine synthase-like 1 isoform X1 n=2 Tax=Bufo gargarizans TaxID=30331 RepID=UPI001CF2941F|nr:tRNA pseudouridine synthase-like 1 isoform X1 [Bufo gargarizans]
MGSSRARYLIFFQYCGTKYSGVVRVPETQAVLGVENYLEMAAQKLRPVGKVTFSISSRTDSGVHAICNSAHVDIERTPDKSPFSEDILVKALNFHLHPEPISILKAIRVSNDFHARFKAISRTYFYRVVTGCKHTDLPVFERNRCWAASERYLDDSRIQEAAQLFVGTHDFSGFRSTSKNTPFESPVKTLLQASVVPSTSLLPNHLQNSNLQYWDFTFKGKSFTYNQVRRMTGALVAVGLGHLTPQQIKLHLEERKPPVFPGYIVAPPSGLFLREVEYDEEDLKSYKPEPRRRSPGDT